MDEKLQHRLIEILIQSVLQSMLSETKIKIKDDDEEQLVFLKEKVWSKIFNDLHLAVATLTMIDNQNNITIH